MLTLKSVYFFLAVNIVAIACTLGGERVVVEPHDNGADLRNPGMGWVFHHYDNSIDGYGEYMGPNYDGRQFPGLTVTYLRLAWSFIEPKEGEYNWSVLDTVIQRYQRLGIRFALRLTVFEASATDGVPLWLREAGCPGNMATMYGQQFWEVDYASEMFLEKYANFLNAVGKRYGDNPNLEFVDIGSLGVWGEGHPVAKQYPISVLDRHIEIHKKAFPHTWIVANDDMARTLRDRDKDALEAKAGRKRPDKDPETLKLLLDKGLAVRDDSLNVYPDPKAWYSADVAELFWKQAPVILEMGHYDYAKSAKAWGGERYSRAVDDYHGSYISIHGNPKAFLEENRELIHEINQKIGYRFQLKSTHWNKTLKNGEKLTIGFQWRNAGAAPCYRNAYPIWTLVNDQGDICAVFADDSFNLNAIMPGKTQSGETSFWVTPKLRPGKYTVCVSVGNVSGTPEVELPLPSCMDKQLFHRDCPAGRADGSDWRRYPLGEIVIDKQ